MISSRGDALRGVQTSAFNLPNDERVREAKGSKKVLLKNVMEAKFRQSGRPVAERVIDPGQAGKVSFDAYFNHTLFHELAHGLGPGIIRGPDGKRVEARLLLKNLYSPIEECKADVLGVWNILFAMDRKLPISFDEETRFLTDAGLCSAPCGLAGPGARLGHRCGSGTGIARRAGSSRRPMEGSGGHTGLSGRRPVARQ